MQPPVSIRCPPFLCFTGSSSTYRVVPFKAGSGLTTTTRLLQGSLMEFSFSCEQLRPDYSAALGRSRVSRPSDDTVQGKFSLFLPRNIRLLTSPRTTGIFFSSKLDSLLYVCHLRPVNAYQSFFVPFFISRDKRR